MYMIVHIYIYMIYIHINTCVYMYIYTHAHCNETGKEKTRWVLVGGEHIRLNVYIYIHIIYIHTNKFQIHIYVRNYHSFLQHMTIIASY